jgi:hypothetical protein
MGTLHVNPQHYSMSCTSGAFDGTARARRVVLTIPHAQKPDSDEQQRKKAQDGCLRCLLFHPLPLRSLALSLSLLLFLFLFLAALPCSKPQNKFFLPQCFSLLPLLVLPSCHVPANTRGKQACLCFLFYFLQHHSVTNTTVLDLLVPSQAIPMIASSVSTLLRADSPCVLGTLPPALVAVLSQTSHGVVAYLSAELPRSSAACGASPVAAESNTSACVPLHDDEEDRIRYAIFEDTVAQRRWTVELSRYCSCRSSGVTPSDEAVSWSIIESTWKDVQRGNHISRNSGGDGAPPTATLRPVPVTGMRYFTKQETWTEGSIIAAPPVEAPPAPLSMPVAPVVESATATAEMQRARRSAEETATEPLIRAASAAVPSRPSTASNGDGDSVAAVQTASTKPSTPATSISLTSLEGLSLHELITQHSGLVRFLVQVLAPQRMTQSLVVQKVCTQSAHHGHLEDVSSPLLCEVHDPAEASSVRRYTEADVAAAVELLTVPHPRQPKQRELKSEAYLHMSLDGFADGELRHKAVNRAYPALALHWPTSAALLDAMERYVDREVVLETRKRHPELTAVEDENRKRTRSHSSSTSREDFDGESLLPSAIQANVPTTPPAHSPQQGHDRTFTRQLFRSLREYPQSLKRGDLHAWCDGAEAAKVRECLQASAILTHASSTSRTAVVGSAATTAVTSTTLFPLPIANEEDVAVLRGQYDMLATAETTMERRLRDYRDTVQELKTWYRAEHCAPQFLSELRAWVQTQEESRTTVVGLYEKVHALRYRLERDLTEYFHLRALHVL